MRTATAIATVLAGMTSAALAGGVAGRCDGESGVRLTAEVDPALGVGVVAEGVDGPLVGVTDVVRVASAVGVTFAVGVGCGVSTPGVWSASVIDAEAVGVAVGVDVANGVGATAAAVPPTARKARVAEMIATSRRTGRRPAQRPVDNSPGVVAAPGPLTARSARRCSHHVRMIRAPHDRRQLCARLTVDPGGARGHHPCRGGTGRHPYAHSWPDPNETTRAAIGDAIAARRKALRTICEPRREARSAGPGQPGSTD